MAGVGVIFFYGHWDIKYVPLLFGAICFNYLVGRQLQTVNDLTRADLFDLPNSILPLGILYVNIIET